ncbi:TonB-dependent receptor [Saccharicrinis sp. GN24d3]|uniref:TonB-dependent receptor n=1 Tax=Saccharicrinis sp. GN24d3 TaxID=3458416 RepID=UPI0040354ACC
MMIEFVFAQGKTDSITNHFSDTSAYQSQRYIQEITVQAPIQVKSEAQWPGAYAKLNNLQLQSGNAYNVKEQLNKVPGVMMQQGTMNTNRITIRGIGSRTPYETNRIKAYWGEMPLTDGDGATSIEDIGLNDISSLEVLKGPSSALFGAGMGGVILLNPFMSDQVPPLNVKSELGSFRTSSQHAQMNWRTADSGYLSIVGGALISDGYRDNSEYKRYNFTFKGQQKLGIHQLAFLYNYRYLNGGIPSSLDSIDFKDNPKKAADSWNDIGGFEESPRHLMSLGVLSPLGNKWVNSFTLFGKISSLEELRPFNRLDEERNAIGFREKLKFGHSWFKGQLGTEMMREHNSVSLFSVRGDNTGQPLSDAEHRRYHYNIFALMEMNPVPRLVAQVAFNYNQTGYRTEESGKTRRHDYDPVFSPRLGLNYQISERIHAFAAIGHGFSAPSMEEAQWPDGSFNPDIRPEEGMNYELGFRWQDASRRMKAEVTAYYMKMNNLLVTERDVEDQFYGKNAGETSHQGLESSLGWAVMNTEQAGSLNLSLSFFASANQFEDFVDDGTDFRGNHLPGIPDANFTGELAGSWRGFHYHLNHQYQGSQYLNDANTKQYAAYHKTNIKVSLDIHLKKLKANIYLGADNIFDTHYASMVVINAQAFGSNLPRYYYPGLPFNVFGGINVNL